MVSGILGKKLGMTQVFDESGRLVPVTVIEAGPCVVTQVKTTEHDGYEAVQVAFEKVKENRVTKPLRGHFAKAEADGNKAREEREKKQREAGANTAEAQDAQEQSQTEAVPESAPEKAKDQEIAVEPMRYIREFQAVDMEGITPGTVIGADIFAAGDRVKITGISKGKGFAGAVKRWHFHGADMGHGSMIHRKPQSGGATDAARTFKGSKRPGRMGRETVTQRGLTVFRVDPARNLLLVKGAVPGASGGLLMIRKQVAGG